MGSNFAALLTAAYQRLTGLALLSSFLTPQALLQHVLDSELGQIGFIRCGSCSCNLQR